MRSERRLNMLKNLRVLLRTAQNCTLVGFTGVDKYLGEYLGEYLSEYVGELHARLVHGCAL